MSHTEIKVEDSVPLNAPPRAVVARSSVLFGVGCVILGAALPCAVLGAIMETERKCNFKVTATHGQCQLQVLHAVSAQAYDQVNYAQARYLAANNITQAHVDYIRGHNQVGVSDNAGS